MNCVLSILVTELSSRGQTSLLPMLHAQVSRFPDVELIGLSDNGTIPLGRKRNAMIDVSRGDYFAFVDDDDMVSPDYVETIRERCLYGPDVVTFMLRRDDGESDELWDFQCVDQNGELEDGTRIMAANHLCAWRSDIGTLVRRHDHITYGADRFWFTPLLAFLKRYGKSIAESHIQRVLYHYDARIDQSVCRKIDHVDFTRNWSCGGVDYFIVDGGVLSATEGNDTIGDAETLEAHDRFDSIHVLRRSEHQPFITVHLE